MTNNLSRRSFMKIASAAGLCLGSFPTLAAAAEGKALAPPPYWLFVHAGGGWDPTILCDPKGAKDELEEDPVNHYFTDDILTAGNIKYAPIGDNDAFFQKHYKRTMVINGLDCTTNSHTVGTRNTWSGKLAEGYPALAALIATASAPDSPMSYVSFGGYDFTAGTVAPTRLGNLGLIRRIAHPNRIGDESDSPLFHTDKTFARVMAAQQRRRDMLLGSNLLPKARKSVGQLFKARLGDNEIKALLQYMPEDVEDDQLRRQAQLSMVAFKAGLAKTSNMTLGGFDTHGDHDNRGESRMTQLLQGIDFAWDEAERLGIADDLIVVVGSDFARTPRYNSGNGKDHWSIGSMMLMGKGIPGNTVIGATTHRQEAVSVDPKTLKTVDSGGVRIECKHVHQSMRKLAGVRDHELVTSLFPLIGVEEMPLLG